MAKKILLLILGITAIFLGTEFFKQPHGWQIIAEKNVLIIIADDNSWWSFGEKTDIKNSILIKNLQPYFWHKKIRDIFEITENAEIQTAKTHLRKISANLVSVRYQNENFLFLGKNFAESDWQNFLHTPISSQNYWLILNQNHQISEFPPPQGILFIGEKNPAKNLVNFARQNQIPLISSKKTGGFSLKFGQEIILKTR